MINLCVNCGERIEAGAKFCPSCGMRLETQPSSEPAPQTGAGIFGSFNIRKEDSVGQWEARESDVSETTMYKRKGFLLLTKNEFIFIARVGVFSKKLKECWRAPLSSVKSVKKNAFSCQRSFHCL